MNFLKNVVEKYRVVSAPDDVWYHGRAVDSDVFDLKYVGREEAKDQEGVGFYFTTDENDAAGYAHPDGVVLTIKLNPRKLVSLTSPAKEADVDYMIDHAPDLEDTLTNWDEDPDSAKAMAKESLMNEASAKNTFESVWYGFYRYEPRTYLENMIKLGYDGHYSSRQYNGIKHIIIYNPNVIQVLKKEPTK